MLKYFHVFEPRGLGDLPLCRALLCIGKVPSKLIAYAWVDTISKDGELSLTPVPHSSPISNAKVYEAINVLCGTSLDSEDALYKALHQHLVELANKKLLVRERWYISQGRKYKTSHFASIDAAIALTPTFPLSAMPQRLEGYREDKDYQTPGYDEMFEGLSGPKPKWTWEDNYVEPANMMELIELHASEVPKDIQHVHESAKGRILRNVKEVRTKTPKMRLMHLLEIIQSMPTVKYKKFKSAPGKPSWNQMMPRWFVLNPPPLNEHDATDLAKLPYNDRMQLMAEQMTWCHRWYSFQESVKRKKAGAEVKAFTWNADSQTMDITDVQYDSDEEALLCNH